ncbi:MAG: GNAT family N-acetyltransferase [Clostridiales bacterium]|nr:GNAT family N-acetyltransferase [Clostridiales bacterium]
MVRLRPFKRQDVKKILPWLADERTMAMWGGGDFVHPLTEEQLLARMDESERTENEWIMAALDEQGQVVGHLYMRNADYERNSLHLGMIVVDDTRRGQGIGRQMVEKAVQYAFEILGARRVTIGVFDCNPRAHTCYERVGFRDEFVEADAMEFYGESWSRFHMSLERQS